MSGRRGWFLKFVEIWRYITRSILKLNSWNFSNLIKICSFMLSFLVVHGGYLDRSMKWSPSLLFSHIWTSFLRLGFREASSCWILSCLYTKRLFFKKKNFLIQIIDSLTIESKKKGPYTDSPEKATIPELSHNETAPK